MDKPWLSNKRHARSWSRTVRSNAKKQMIFMWAFAGLWNLIAFPLAPMAWTEAGALVGLLFPLVGVALIWYAVHKSRQWRRYGVTPLTLDPYPGSIGGHVGGSIELPAAAGTNHDYQVTLECVHSYMSGSGKNRSRRYDVEWQARGPAEAALCGSGLRLDFRFDVPEGLPESERKRGAYHMWRLQLSGEQHDVPLDRTFEIAVFATAESSRHIQVDTTAAGHADAAQEISAALTEPGKAAELRNAVGLSIEQRGDWLRLLFHAGRHKLLGMLFLAVGLVCLGVGLLSADADFVTRWVFRILGLLSTGIGLYLPFNSLDVRVSPREITGERSLFGFVIRRQRIRPRELHKLEIAKGATVSVHDKTTVYYRLVGKGSFGKFRLVDGLPDRGLVKALRDQVMISAGLKQS